MPENPDSGATETIEGTPSPKIEQESPTAELEAALQKALAPFQKDLEEVKSQQRALQSDKDRTNKRTEDKVEKLLADWENAKKLGMTQEEFVEKKEMAERLSRIEELLSHSAPAKPSGGTEDSGALSVAKAIAKAANIPETDAEYLSVLQKNVENPLKMAEDLSALAVSRATKPIPTSAQSPAPVGGVRKEVDEQALAAELKKLQMHPTKNAKRIEEIENLLGW